MKQPANTLKTRKQMNSNTMLLVITIILFVVLYAGGCVAYASRGFLTVQTFLNVLRSSAGLICVASGMTCVMLTGGIDISVGSLVALDCMILAYGMTEMNMSAPVAVILVLVLGLVAAVLLGIAVLNFVNLLVVKTVSRRREFAVYQSLGMTVSQLRRLVLLEGGFYALLMAAVLLPAALAFALGLMPGVIADLSWVAVYTFDLTPLWIILPVIAALALLTPLLCLYWITKGTIQERLGAVE